MKIWSYGINSIHKKASIYLEEVSWWVFAPIIEWLRTNGHCWNTKSLVAYTHLSVNVSTRTQMLTHKDSDTSMLIIGNEARN